MINKIPLPTDNLYKFIALFGLTIFLVSFVPYYHFHKLGLDIIDLEIQGRILVAEVEHYGYISAVRDEELKTIEERIKEQKEKSLEEQKFHTKGYYDFQINLKEEHLLLTKKNQEYAANGKKVLLKKRYLKYELCAAIAGNCFGIALLSLGFSFWYYKLQKYQDMIVKNKAGESH